MREWVHYESTFDLSPVKSVLEKDGSDDCCCAMLMQHYQKVEVVDRTGFEPVA